MDDVLRRIADEERRWPGLVFVLPLRVYMRYMVRIHLSSNNIAEYVALINGLHIAIKLGIPRLDVWGDS